MALFQVIREIFSPAAAAPETGDDNALARQIEAAYALLEAGNIAGAEAIHRELASTNPDPAVNNLLHLIHLTIVKDRFPGPEYLEWLVWFHENLQPKAYLEIGVESGQSLRFARHPTKAVGVDPEIHIVYPQECWVKLFKLPSDEFFAQRDLHDVFGEEQVDLAFIDGLHTYDQALKDFVNVERFSSPGTVVLFHDILPAIPITAERERESVFWVGDTWKVLLILLKNRPDLKIHTIPAFPSGLAVVTNLDRNNKLLEANLDRLIDEAADIELATYFSGIEQSLNVISNDFASVKKILDDLKK